MARITNAQYGAEWCQSLAAEYAARAMNLRGTRWNDDAIEAQEWSAYYAERACRCITPNSEK